MAGPIRLVLRVQGLRELRRTVSEAALLAPHWRAAMEEIGREGLAAARSAAPVGPSFTGHVGGQTSAKLRVKIQARPLPLWVRIETTAVRAWTGHGSYSYPKRVEWDPKLRHAGWLRGAVAHAQTRFETALRNAAARMEAVWSTAR